LRGGKGPIRNKMYAKLIKQPGNTEEFEHYKKYRNKLTHIIE